MAVSPSGKGVMFSQLWVIMVTGFVDMMGFLIVLPLLPFYAKRFGADPAMVGYLVGAYAFMQLVTAPGWGRLSDRWGRRPVILLGLAASAGAFILFALAQSCWMLMVSRLVQGAAGGTIGVIQAYVTDSVSPGQRSKALGWVTAATSAGVMIGPAVASFAVRFGETAPGFVAAGLCLLNLAFAARWLPEPPRESADSDDGPQSVEPKAAIWSSLWEVMRRPTGSVSALIWLYAISMMAFMSMNGVLALYLEAVFGVSEENIGWFYVYVGALSLIMRALILGPVIDRLGEVRTMRLGLVSLALGLAAIPLPASLWGLAIAVIFVPVGTAFLFPATTSMVSSRGSRRQIGQILGVQQTFGGIARWLGPSWAGLLFQHTGIRSPFWVAASLVVLVGIFAGKVIQPERRAEEAAEGEAPPATSEPDPIVPT
ncbi:MAG: MFS transporter [Acidobacteriota bacterium]